MWFQFFLENMHFAVGLFGALVMFAVFWLYFDAWSTTKMRREIPKMIGFLLISLGFALQAVYIESTLLPIPLLDPHFHRVITAAVMTVGYVLLIVGVMMEPLQTHPEVEGVTKKSWLSRLHTPWIAFSTMNLLAVIYPLLVMVVSGLYWRRATTGLEQHIKPVARAFFVIGLAEILAATNLLQGTDNVDLYKLVAPFGLVWIIAHVLLLVGTVMLGRWVWQYLLERLQSQLFMIFTAATLVIFLLVTVSFTALLLGSLQTETLSRLETDVKVLNFALDSKKEELLSDVQVIAKNNQVHEALEQNEISNLDEVIQTYLIDKRLDKLVFVDENGQILSPGSDPDQVGGSLSGNSIIQRALLGHSVSSIMVQEGVLAPDVTIVAAAPVTVTDQVVGAVMVGVVVDSTFVDGVKKATGLDAAVYGDNTLSASTFIMPDGKSRWIGIQEQNQDVKTRVLQEGAIFAGMIDVLNVPYFVTYAPLTDVDDVAVGMLFVGQPQIATLQLAGRSIEITFLITAVLIVLLIWPSYRISRYITNQLR